MVTKKNQSDDEFTPQPEGFIAHQQLPFVSTLTHMELGLISTKIPIKYAEYKISNSVNKMVDSYTTSISHLGINFESHFQYQAGMILRVLVYLPNYWAIKMNHVSYNHTQCPDRFQLLVRVISCEENYKKQNYTCLGENIYISPVDVIVLNEHLGIGVNKA